jgi:hypothetical protein
MNRLAGKVLGDFFKTGVGLLSNAAEQGTLGYLRSAANAVDAPGVAGNVAQLAAGLNPTLTAKLAGAAAPVAA